ncbi:unnamed protein product [Larinioides sclopetarius]|uniref:Glutaredoxin domain-containing protein n=1 Tax=Larinioides sclopetarius TaxID=280406 RepID=A0AAV1ZZ96_9ARAC
MAAAQVDAHLLGEVEKYIKENRVMIFSKSRCPYCDKVKKLLKSLGVDFYALELDVIEGGNNLQQAMGRKAGRTSVPQVFIEGQHIGGCDDTMEAHNSGKLKALLKL